MVTENPFCFEQINIEARYAASPEALAHSPSQMPLSCPVAPPKRQMPLSCPAAPPSQRELHKDGGGGGGGVARRARAARAPKAKSCTTSSATYSKTPCAASLTCWRRRRRQRRRRRRWWWCGSLAGCARDQPCASWGSRLPNSRLKDRTHRDKGNSGPTRGAV